MTGQEQELPVVRKLLELAERVEAATGPDRELDAEVCAAFGVSANQPELKGLLGDPFVRVSEDGRRVVFGTHHDGKDHSIASREPLPVTASLDAAMTLKPDWWRVRTVIESQSGLWRFDLISHDGTRDTPFDAGSTALAATPALALTAACLKARASGGGQ